MGSIGNPHETFEAIGDTLSKYDVERQKRLRSEGLSQYIDISTTQDLEHYAEDPWVVNNSIPDSLPVTDGTHCKALLVGTGYGALLFAVRLILIAGFQPEDIVFVDNAGGFGGTWYWNRYPGLMCDVESACYMPLLEETGYVPKHRYSYGPELRSYAELVASKWNLKGRAVFAARVAETKWDNQRKEWISTISQRALNGAPARTVALRSDYFILTAGLLTRPKLPKFPGLLDYKGHSFHTSRWDYSYTGGAADDPTLSQLKDKRIGLLGTGATAIQVVPQLAKWAKELYVIQRTPSSVDFRGQRLQDAKDFGDNISVGPGWQRARRENMAALISNIPVKCDMVQDGWTSFPSFSGLVGGPNAGGATDSKLADYMASLHVLDLPRSERIRARVSETVKDKATAQSLQAWYAGWCKRPGFHDDYLEAFNLPNVHLVDTAGAGVESMTEKGFIANGEETAVDLFIFSTGYETFRTGNPSSRARMIVSGRSGQTMDEKGAQAAGTVNVVHTMDVMATHAANVIATASRQGGGHKKTIIEPTAEAEEAWAMTIAENALIPTPLANCTPSYSNGEGKAGDAIPPEHRVKVARNSSWAKGLLDFQRILEDWRAQGDLQGLDVQVVA